MAIIPVVKIKHETAGFCLINADDFNPSIHQLYEDEKPAKTRKKEKVEEEVNVDQQLL